MNYRVANGEGQRAWAKIDGALVELKNVSAFRFACKPGELVTASWEAAGTTLAIALITDGPGDESCWFRGLLTVNKGSRSATRKIVGACGC